MKKSALFWGVLVILIFGLSGSPANAQTPSPQLSPSEDYVPNKIIVKYKKGQSRAKISQSVVERESKRKTFFGRAAQQMGDIVARVRGETLPEEKLGRIQNAEKKFGVSTKRLSKFKPDDELTLAESTTTIDVPNAVSEFKKLPEVEYAEPDFIAHAVDTVPYDPDFAAKQWGPQKIQAPKAWDIATGSADLIIGVVDTGVRLNHPDLAGKIIPGYDFYNDDSDPSDDYGHGTHVAGIISAVTNNAVGMAGLSWQGRILPVKVCSRLGSCPYDAIGKGIEYAADNGAKIINISLGGYSDSQYMKSMVDYAYAKDVLLVVAAGNDGNTNINYPAKYANVIAVGAINNDAGDTRARFSNYGTGLDIVAPGVDIWSTVTSSGSLGDPSGYRNLSGTSMSTPHVAGAAALLLAKYPNLKPGTYNSSNPNDAIPGTLSYYLYHGAEDRGAAGRDDTYGWGRLNIYNSLLLPQVTPTPTYVLPTTVSTNTPAPTYILPTLAVDNIPWQSAAAARLQDTIPSPQQILELRIHYNATETPILAISSAAVKTGYASKPPHQEKDYLLELHDKDNRVLFSRSFAVPKEIPGPPPLDSQERPAKEGVTLSVVDFSVTVPWNPNTSDVFIMDTAGIIITRFLLPIESTRVQESAAAPRFFTVFGDEISNVPSSSKRSRVSALGDDVLDITFIGDDYSTGEMATFHTDVNRFTGQLLTYEPFRSRAAQIRFNYIDNTRDLACYYAGRLIMCDYSAITQAVNDAGAPNEKVVVIYNNAAYGGSGGYIAMAYNGYWGPAVFVHEFGHSLAYLVDEYLLGYPYRTDRNCYDGTPPNSLWQGIVPAPGYFLECDMPSWYRSSPDSIMRSLTAPYFNAVSQKYLNESIDYYVSPIVLPSIYPTPTLHPTITPSPKPTILPTFTPSPSSLTIRLSFDILPKNYNPQLTIWFMQNGKIIKEEKAQTYYDGSVFPPMKAIIYNSPVGTFDIKIKTDRHLSKKQTGVILKQGSNQIAFDALISGDIDAGAGKSGDDEINLLDYNRLLTEWGKSGKFVSDLNYSEKVDSLDYDLLMKNYNKTGENN